ncbi:MAG: hypothetical protein KDA88_17660 [Planctomycetaceae bacterium]|nr:hypothetical protein [Planctomycetaceae bacterium]MCB9953885.1 hypothetical protein [Planctomycetaceae bacterium]
MSAISEFGGTIYKWMARAIGDPTKRHAKSIWAATLSVAEALMSVVNNGLATDIRRIKNAHIRGIEVRTEKEEAEAELAGAKGKQVLAEAVEASNRATLHKRKDAEARIERRRREAEAAKTEAEAEAIRMDAETRRITAETEGLARLIEALSLLKQQGGGLAVDPDELRRLLGRDGPSETDSQL